ncbi:M28 family peptidase [Aureibacter tunicatorum]|uniref:Zn-dependent M28 family amino/carboxypeptidase n=1 Tax=Aureibacter tunicatorum TaxID=866807 RepID=A0AAE3XQJ3_9BACT|nr:M28 family peptidase [Aureibacter tunicatorum]MDR6240233.1 Zn-dependent M28 family amino/carboxypeptidase [Aureibacter tunicatorum]BDD05886.1 glutamine cyclotransferase [Aureibacter tunicatorum]
MMKIKNLNVFALVIILAINFSSCTKKQSSQTKSVSKPSKESHSVPVNVPVFNSDSAYQFIQDQVDFGPRVPNTRAHTDCGEYLYSKLKQYADSVTKQEFEMDDFRGETLYLTNYIASFAPEKSERILLSAHWDTREWADKDSVDIKKPILGANDGGSGVGVLLEIARLLQQNKAGLNVGIDIILFDGEDVGEPQFYKGPHKEDTWCLGSQYWSKNARNEGYTARYGILLDMVGAKDAKFFKEGFSERYAGKILSKVWKTGQKLGYSDKFIDQIAYPITDDHYYINTLAHIRTIDIIDYDNDFGEYHHTHDDNMSIIDKSTLNAVGRTVLQTIYEEK